MTVKVVKDGGLAAIVSDACPTFAYRTRLKFLTFISIPRLLRTGLAAKFSRSDSDELVSMFESEIKFFADVLRRIEEIRFFERRGKLAKFYDIVTIQFTIRSC